MVTLKLFLNTASQVTYTFFIEGDAHRAGKVIVDKPSLDFRFEDHDSNEYEGYKNSAARAVRQFVRENEYPEEGIEAWY